MLTRAQSGPDIHTSNAQVTDHLHLQLSSEGSSNLCHLLMKQLVFSYGHCITTEESHKNLKKSVYLFLIERGEGAERAGEKESEAGSRLRVVSTEPMRGLNSQTARL